MMQVDGSVRGDAEKAKQADPGRHARAGGWSELANQESDKYFNAIFFKYKEALFFDNLIS